MLNTRPQTQSSMEFVCIDELVPSDHLLRKVDKHIDFSFIHDLVKDLYCADNGRPALDPTLLFKMLLVGYLFGVRSERQLVREVQVNVAYRWFLGLNLTDKIPDASTFSQNRRRRFNESGVYQQIFDEIVLQAISKRLVSGKHLFTDSTHLKANANKHKKTKVQVAASRQDYMDALDSAVEEDRLRHGKKPLAPTTKAPVTREINKSTTDPDSGYMVRDEKPKGFFYLDHRTVDGKCNIVTDVHVTPGNIHDSVPYLKRLDRQIKRFDLPVEAVGLDAGYFTSAVCKGIEDRGLYGVMGYRRPTHKKGYFYKREYQYDADSDTYKCPAGQQLIYKTTNREGYRHYQSDPRICQHCEHLSRCTRNAKQVKTVTRHVWEASKERINQHRLTSEGKVIYKRRKETVERSFADAKQLHGYRYARYKGLNRVQGQCLLVAAAQNIKKIALMAA
ncbi:IS1182 family transposase [Zhongshania marina]|uniref:IS5/IS1182 family transposase n=4 Tax=Zhongshania marina TaxID=2304603 RepID=A0A2S4HHB9_9GAMM|nr:IS1182 family transposase [Marortus luteolus]POP52301.1 IS5/IS1182 family transposase [Marortus luteolus]POP52718.1 IS5/IS1182 family transposase [Marortus luteolus]POP52722.1 IS5/IS1182 family transposase [Marortus luteolus]POP53247.1 IS5/IS1182 family transposase [Marortus luteolus]POP53310.1 IS5/IS1182 family transposase [Marortus luteolus]